MNNTHRIEKLRLAEAPDGTAVWVKLPNATCWNRRLSVLWLSDHLYVVDDGFFVEERKAFAEGETVEFRLIGREHWANKVHNYTVWYKDFEYRVKDRPWYELKENIGKLVKVSVVDNEEKAHNFDILQGYVEDELNKFHCINANWKYAWLMEPNKLAKGVEDE